MGSDAEHKNEVQPQAVVRSDLYVADSLTQTRQLSELHHATVADLFGEDRSFSELGQIAVGAVVGRTNDQQISIADLTGTGIQDTAIANLAFIRTLAANVGTKIEDNLRKTFVDKGLVRAGSGNLNSGDKWNFCLTLA
ncbi:hypothetical protein GHK46_32870 [Sinorhizobium medicae]|nr:hypothetical protein [Sinorhizobium medicae]